MGLVRIWTCPVLRRVPQSKFIECLNSGHIGTTTVERLSSKDIVLLWASETVLFLESQVSFTVITWENCHKCFSLKYILRLAWVPASEFYPNSSI